MLSLVPIVLLPFAALASVSYSVSGFSSGAFFSVQMHVSHSSTVFGAGIVAGGPYHCSMGSYVRVQTACTINPYLIDLTTLTSYANISSQEGLIDDISNLPSSKVFIYSAKQDLKVSPGVVQKTLEFYQTYVPAAQIKQVFGNNGVHVWPTVGYGGPCWYFGSPYIGNCDYDTAGEILQFLYGSLNDKTNFNNSNLFSFDQSTYSDVWKAGLSTRGWVYATDYCRSQPIRCRLHVHFHGCQQDYAYLGKTYITETGFGEWAESNNLVILFPQTATGTLNVDGCWDFGGIFGADYDQRSGLQVSAIESMAQNFTEIVQGLV
jgi:hypothetical protein